MPLFQPFRDVPIKRKVTLVIMTASMVTLVLAFLSLVVFQWINARANIRRTLRVQAEILAANSTAALTFGDKNAGAEVLAALKAQPHVVCACLYRPDRQLFAHYGLEKDMDDLPPDPLPEGFYSEGAQVVLLRPILLDGRRVGTLYLRFDSRAIEREMILPFLLILGGSMLVALLTAIVLSTLFQRVISRPILRLTSTARAVADNKDYTVRADSFGSDELGTLTKAFNQMLARIQDQDGALRDSESRYRLLFQNNPVPMFVHDAETFTLLAANEAAIQHYGFPLAELRQMKFGDLEAPGQTGEESSVVPPEKKLTLSSRQLRHRKRDGTLIDVDVATHLIDSSDRPARLALCLDITARKEAEQRLATAFDDLEAKVCERTRELSQAKVAAEAASEAKSRFLAMMSHEIRTPLNGVTGMLHLLQPDKPTAQQQRWIAMAQNSSDTLLRVINDILDFSKIEAGKLDLHLAPTLLHTSIGSTAATFAHKAAGKGLAWSLSIDPGVPRIVEADADRLAQVLVNLLGNAVKFTDAGSVGLRVTARAESSNVASVRFAVTDTGPGLSPAQEQVLFKPFSQVDNSTTRRHGGSGLGLGICKQLVELMGGTISVDTAVGKGSTFWFELPFKKTTLAPATEPTARQEPQSFAQGVPRRVLLAEDNEVNQELARELIQSTGCECDCVVNGHDAVRAVRDGGYDLVFMDCMMPGMDGYGATQAIRMEEAGRASAGLTTGRLPIVAMTANAMTGDREECLAAGMDDYLSKPLDPDAVASMIRKWLTEGRQYARPARDRSEAAAADSAGSAGPGGEMAWNKTS